MEFSFGGGSGDGQPLNTLLVGAFLIDVTCELTLLYTSTILLLYQDSFYNII
jgi:hypothetical protein